MKFEKWWNANYNVRSVIKIENASGLKHAKNTVYVKCLIIEEGRTNAGWQTGGTYEIRDKAENGYHLSIWIKKKDEKLLSTLKHIFSEYGLHGITSMSENRLHGTFPEKYTDFAQASDFLKRLEVSIETRTTSDTRMESIDIRDSSISPSQRNSASKTSKKKSGVAIGIGIAVVLALIAIVFVFEINFEFPIQSTTFQDSNTQTFSRCKMTTYGTINADVICPGKDTFHLVRDLPLNAAEIDSVTLTKTGNFYKVEFDTPLGITVSYDLTNPNYQQTIFEELEFELKELKIPTEELEKMLQEIRGSIQTVPLMVEEIIQETFEGAIIPDVKIPEIEIPKFELPKIESPPPPTLSELKQITLDDINKYRMEKDLRPVKLGNAISPQLYAEELGKERCINHISDNGDGPMLRYKKNGDRMYLIFENIVGGYGSSWNMEGGILDANYDMMYDDAHANWGHRDNIMNPKHTSVSIGISDENGRLTMVQDFEQSLPPGYSYHPSSFKKQPVDDKFCW